MKEVESINFLILGLRFWVKGIGNELWLEKPIDIQRRGLVGH